MPTKEALETRKNAVRKEKHLEDLECKMCGELPSTPEEVFEDGLCPHCLNLVETD
jgi:formylmethanofuran dehydrogenase subunit E